jgi:hypothetical protein
MPLRVAVYFSGHLRNLSDNWANYKRVFTNTDSIQFDFYFTLWRKNHVAESRSWADNNIKGKILMEPRDISEEEVLAICPGAKVKILGEYIVEESHGEYKKHIASQFYIIGKSFEEVPEGYDYYIRMRTDLYFFKGIDWDKVFSKKCDLIMPKSIHYNRTNWPNGKYFNDYFWISDWATGKYISRMHEVMPKESKLHVAERYLAIHLTNKPGISINHYDFDIALERRTRGFDDNLEETRVYTARRIAEGDYT